MLQFVAILVSGYFIQLLTQKILIADGSKIWFCCKVINKITHLICLWIYAVSLNNNSHSIMMDYY